MNKTQSFYNEKHLEFQNHMLEFCMDKHFSFEKHNVFLKSQMF